MDLTYWLVGGLEHQFYFPINIGFIIIPNDVHIFQRGSNHQPAGAERREWMGMDGNALIIDIATMDNFLMPSTSK